MMSATVRGNCLVQTSVRKSPSIYDEDKKNGKGFIMINSIPHYFNSKPESHRSTSKGKIGFVVSEGFGLIRHFPNPN